MLKAYRRWRRRMLRAHLRARDHELLVMMQAAYRRGVGERFYRTGRGLETWGAALERAHREYPHNRRIMLEFVEHWEW